MSRRSWMNACVLVAAVLVASGCGSVSRGAGNLGSRVCVKNESPALIVVGFTKKDTATGEGQVTPGAQACGEGTFFIGDDVKGTIQLPRPSLDKTFSASNLWIGSPEATLYERAFTCLTLKDVEGTSKTFDDGVLQYRLERLADDQWKEFVITISRSENPTDPDATRKCEGGVHGGGQ